MKIFQAALLAAAVTAIKLDDEIPEELAADLKADLGITDADLEALEKLPPKDKKKMIKEAAKGMGEEGLGDDLIKEMGLELADEGEGDKPAGDKKKPKKKGPPKEGEEGDMELPPLDELPPPCSEDDDECMAEVEKEIKKMLKEEGICSEDDDSCLGDAMIMIEEAVEGETADGLELGEDKKPKKKGPKGDDEGDMDLSGLDEDDLPSDLPSDLGSELPPLEFAQEIAELGESDLEDLADACSLDDEPCVEEAIKKMAGGEKPPKKEKKELGEDKKPKKKGPPKSEGGDEDDLPSDLDLSDLPSCGSDDECKEMVKEVEEELELGEKKKPKKLGEKKKPKKLGEDKKPKKKGPPKSEGDLDDLPSDLDLDDLPSDVEDLELELGEKKKPKKGEELGEKKKPKKLGEDKKPKGPKPPKKEGGVEGEMVDAVKQYDADGSGKISAEEGKQLLKDVGFSDDVAGMITEGLGEELDEEPTPEDIVKGVMDLAEFIAAKEGVAPEDVADAADEVDLSKVTKEDIEEFVTYLEEEE